MQQQIVDLSTKAGAGAGAGAGVKKIPGAKAGQ